MEWPRLLAYITGRVDQELLLRNEYLAAENRILQTFARKDGYKLKASQCAEDHFRKNAEAGKV